MTISGSVTKETELTGLDSFSAKGQTVEQVTVRNDYLFLRFAGQGENEQSASFAILQKTSDEFVSLNMEDVYPRKFVSFVDNRYLLFDTYVHESGNTPASSSRDLFIFDLQNGTAEVVDLGLNSIDQIAGDNTGNIVASAQNQNGEHNWFWVKDFVNNGN